MKHERFLYLIQQQAQGNASSAETEELKLLLDSGQEALTDALAKQWQNELPVRYEQETAEALQPYIDRIVTIDKDALPHTGRKSVFRLYRWGAAAAILLLAVGIGLLYHRPTRNKIDAAHQVADIQPGHEGAILTLPDGRQLSLDSMTNGSLANESGSVLALQDHQLIYQASEEPTKDTTTHLLTTPGGRQFQLVLPDGSRVWLNAASSIRYPAAFTGKERRVIVTGEAFLEVAADAKRPFRVTTPRSEVQVLGTGFNINAYADEEAEKITLLTGKVQVEALQPDRQHPKTVVLLPGQQSLLSPQQLQVQQEVNTRQVTAWRYNRFSFDEADVTAIMRQLSRWYNVDIIWEGTPSRRYFYGEIGRDLTLTQTIRNLEKMNIHCRLDNHTLYVSAGK